MGLYRKGHATMLILHLRYYDDVDKVPLHTIHSVAEDPPQLKVLSETGATYQPLHSLSSTNARVYGLMPA